MLRHYAWGRRQWCRLKSRVWQAAAAVVRQRFGGAWEVWRAATCVTRSVDDRFYTVLVRTKLHHRRVPFDLWRGQSSEHRRAASQGVGAVACFLHASKVGAWRSWRHEAERQGKVEATALWVGGRWRCRALRCGWDACQNHRHRAAEIRLVAQRCLAWFTHKATGLAYRQWRGLKQSTIMWLGDACGGSTTHANTEPSTHGVPRQWQSPAEPAPPVPSSLDGVGLL
jgi:hypothetical protein